MDLGNRERGKPGAKILEVNSSLYVTCTTLARTLHVPCTSLARPLHVSRTSLALHLHVPCTSLVYHLHITCTSFARTEMTKDRVPCFPGKYFEQNRRRKKCVDDERSRPEHKKLQARSCRFSASTTADTSTHATKGQRSNFLLLRIGMQRCKLLATARLTQGFGGQR